MYRMVLSDTRKNAVVLIDVHSVYSGHSVAIRRLIGLANGKSTPLHVPTWILLLLYSMVRSGYLEEC